MVYLRLLIFCLLSCMGHIFASDHDIKKATILVQFSDISGICVSSDMNVRNCVKLGIKAGINDMFVNIKEIKEFTGDDRLSISFFERYTHDNLVIRDKQSVFKDKVIDNVTWLCALKKENRELINYVQESTYGVYALPINLLQKKLQSFQALGEDEIAVSDQAEIQISEMTVAGLEKTFKIVVNVRKKDLEQMPFDDWVRKFQAKKMAAQANGWSQFKNPFFCLVGLFAIYALCKNLKLL
jgi:hypothetical protein